MGLLFQLSLRNLLRQKRRNLLLGIGIAFGMMILVIANSFAHGMVDVLIKDVVSNAFGHLVIHSSSGNGYFQVVHDRERILKIIHDSVKKEDLLDVDESLGMVGQAIGNGESDNVVIVGVAVKTKQDQQEFLNNFFTLVKGNYNDYFSKEIQYPIIISEQKAKSLKVKLHDDIRVRLPIITGQMQAAKLNVIAIVNASNSFMDICLFMDADRVKNLLGFQPWEAAGLQLTLRNPQQTAKKYADILHQKLQPEILSIIGNVGSRECQILAFKNDDKTKTDLLKYLRILQGDPKTAFAKDSVMLPKQLAQQLGLGVGSEFTYQYQTRYRGLHEERFKVKAIYETNTKLSGNVIFANGEEVYKIYDRYLPRKSNWNYIDQNDPLHTTLATEWKLLERSQDSETWQKKLKRERQNKSDQTKIDVITMYEGASDILKLEGVLNLITIIAVLILFFIILIGVINTLRMTIKERTREIGTIRAIGMQKRDVRNEFILETLLLTVISCIAGIILAVIVMQVLSLITFNVSNALSMILKEKHLFFKIDPLGIMGNFILILMITAITAFFPAKRAANLLAVEALRHHE